MPDQQFAPNFEDDIFISGDGQVDGKTPKVFSSDNNSLPYTSISSKSFSEHKRFLGERAARKPRFGRYRNR